MVDKDDAKINGGIGKMCKHNSSTKDAYRLLPLCGSTAATTVSCEDFVESLFNLFLLISLQPTWKPMIPQ